MSLSLGVVMDPISAINYHKDSTLAMLLAAQARGWTLHYMEETDLELRDGAAWGHISPLRVKADENAWFEVESPTARPLASLDAILMRKDPPFDMEYVHATYVLEQAEREGVLVVNRAASLRDANEKIFATRFPQCIPPSLVTSRPQSVYDFLAQHGDIVLKPLDAMGGSSVFRIRQGDPNAPVIADTLTEQGRRHVMAQRFIPEITAGDKRILLIDGEPCPYALARVPASGDFRGNLAAGARGVGIALTDRDRWICAQVGPTLKAMGLLFVGLDVIGDYLTEINVTSPTCIRELDRLYDLNIGAQLMDVIAAYSHSRHP